LELFLSKNANEWIQIIEDSGVPCGPINTIEEIMIDKQIQARNMIVEVEDKKAGTIKIAGNPIKMTNIPEETKREPIPELSEHTSEILTKYLGFNVEKIKQLKEDGVI